MMSHLTEYSSILGHVMSLLEGEEPSAYTEFGRLGGVLVQFPLPARPLDELEEFYRSNQLEVESSCLQSRRKCLYGKFIQAAYRAHWAVRQGPKYGSVYHLQTCVSYILEAFKIMEEAKEFDDGTPVGWSEVYIGRNSKAGIALHEPQEYWLLFKLESLFPVLELSIRVLRLILPDLDDVWDEWEYTLLQETWLQQFIIDSRASSYKDIPFHAPRRDEIIDTSISWTC
ncbi:hypothetical protein F5Y16DRAFT_147315 [Xylariaceae sp. FL0255]|nr:hypothetical protein F5Y16DRAFT_147315 [Xylariaceae sp. FL0255]